MKLLFLDIDGVLNRDRDFAQQLGLGADVIGQECVDQLRRVITATDCRIVLSSTWRLLRDWPTRLRAHGIDVPRWFAGPMQTDDLSSRPGACRGDEIAAYLAAHPCDRYAIVDDDTDMRPEQLPFFVRTNMVDGLTPEVADRLIAILGSESETRDA